MTKEEKLQGWVARDQCSGETSDLYVGLELPRRGGEDDCGCGVWCDFREFMALPREMFPEVQWENEPVEVEIIIRRKN